MAQPLHNYLRTYRKRFGLSQKEVAFLLNCQEGSKVSRYERFTREPNLQTVLAYEMIFAVPARELFPRVYRKVEKQTVRRAQLLARKLSAATPGQTINRRLLDLLRSISSGPISEPAQNVHD